MALGETLENNLEFINDLKKDLKGYIDELNDLCKIYREESRYSTLTFLLANILYYLDFLNGSSEELFPISISPESVVDNLAQFTGKFTSSYGAFFASELFSNISLSKLVKIAWNTSKLESIIKKDSKVKKFFRHLKYLVPIVAPAVAFKVFKYLSIGVSKLYSLKGQYIPSKDYSMSTLASLVEIAYYIHLSNYYLKKYNIIEKSYSINDYVLNVVEYMEAFKNELERLSNNTNNTNSSTNIKSIFDDELEALLIVFLKTAYPYMKDENTTPPHLLKYVQKKDGHYYFLGIPFEEFKKWN